MGQAWHGAEPSLGIKQKRRPCQTTDFFFFYKAVAALLN